jgi:nicotinate-nucleotide adenylyltransferase
VGAGPTRIGIVGGTFDPPHNGHLVVAVHARDQLRLDLTLLVVANAPWQKVGERAVTPPSDRLAMVEAMVAGVDGVEASTIEIERGGLTYTADTLAEVDRRHPGAEQWLVIGADVARSLDTWSRLDEVRALAGLAVVDRGGDDPPIEELRRHGWRVAHVAIPRIDVSSSDLRARLADGRPIEGLADPATIRLIRQRGLYAAGR